MFLNAYYFRQHMYTLVPHQLREDLSWMADVGTRAVSVAVLEQDLHASQYNLEIIRRETSRLGMAMYVVPSRWGGLVAGSPKVPSVFSVTHPETWVLGEDGKPRFNSISGVISSVHHPATLAMFCDSLDKLTGMIEVDGVIWDEPKLLSIRDCSPAAERALGRDAPLERHVDALALFFDKVGAHVRSISPGTRLCLFMYAFASQGTVDRFAAVEHLDDLGCDGRPWAKDDGGGGDSDHSEPATKLLVTDGPRFIEAAARSGKRSLFLIENHSLARRDYELMDRRLPEVLGLEPGHLIYYYYPRNVEEPDEAMGILQRHLRGVR